MPAQPPIVDLADAIQLAVAPAFLLAGVGSVLGVLTNRLGRIIDRRRALEEGEAAGRDPSDVRNELAVLRWRALLISRAIGFCTLAALLVAGVVAALFLGTFATFVRVDFSGVIAVTFVFAMLSLISGLVTFLREVRAAIRFLKSKTGGTRRSAG